MTSREKWSGDKGSGKSKGGKGKKGKGKGKGKGKLNSVENSKWQEGWWEAGTKHGDKSKPKDGGMKSMLTVGGKMSRQDQVQVQTIRRLGNQQAPADDTLKSTSVEHEIHQTRSMETRVVDAEL